MGRYYSGDIEGKFWFAVQDSDDADFFGCEGRPPSVLEYDFEELLQIQDIDDEAINADGLYAWCYEQLATLPQCEEMENV